MVKYIENIIEIILEDVSCHHEVDSDGSGKTYDDVNYSLTDEKTVIEKCIKALPGTPEITKEFIEKKAKKLHQVVYGSLMKCDFKCHMMEKFRKQIRALFEDEDVE